MNTETSQGTTFQETALLLWNAGSHIWNHTLSLATRLQSQEWM